MPYIRRRSLYIMWPEWTVGGWCRLWARCYFVVSFLRYFPFRVPVGRDLFTVYCRLTFNIISSFNSGRGYVIMPPPIIGGGPLSDAFRPTSDYSTPAPPVELPRRDPLAVVTGV